MNPNQIIEINLELSNVKGSKRHNTYVPIKEVSHITHLDYHCIIHLKNSNQIKCKREQGQKILDAWAPEK